MSTNMRKLTALLCAATIAFACLTGCSGQVTPSSLSPIPPPAETKVPAESTSTAEQSESNLLVAYFTYGENAPLADGVDASSSASIQYWNGELTGNTGLVAHMIAEDTGAELFSIRTEQQYPASYDATMEQGEQENDAGFRPELTESIEGADGYDVIFLGFPNWWYDMPMAIYSFLDEYDFSGKTIIPFVTSGGSGFSGAIDTIRELEPDAYVMEGFSVGARGAADAGEAIEAWLTELGF